MSTATLNPTNAADPGKFLTFELGGERYGVPALRVREIIRLCEITQVPQMPKHIKGVINLRGKIIPVMDLRTRFNLEDSENTERTCIIVVEVVVEAGGKRLTGIIVDGVDEVANISADEIEPTPNFANGIDTSTILCMAKRKEGVTSLLDIDRVVDGEGLHLTAR